MTTQQTEFEELPPECYGSVSVTTFRHNGVIYTISTACIVHLLPVQRMYDERAGYRDKLGSYETMLFINRESDTLYPFGDLPGHAGLGVFQRYDGEEEARDGHQTFVTQVRRILEDQQSG